MLTDKDFTHLICDFSSAKSIMGAFKIPASDIIRSADHVSVGQQNLQHDFGGWSQARLPALEAALDVDLVEWGASDHPFTLLQNVRAMDEEKPLLLWLDCSVQSQLTAAFICYIFTSNGWDLNRLHELRYTKVPELYSGILGVLNENELRKRRPEISKLPLDEINRYSSIWKSYGGANLDVLLPAIFDSDVSKLTMDAFSYLGRRLPSRMNGLNEVDHDLLKYMSEQAPHAIRAIADAMGHNETPDMLGDSYLFARLKRFGSEKLAHPLIEIDNPTGLMRDCKIRILPIAHEILAGRANMIELNGLDDWLGGVHLTPDNFVYREDIGLRDR